MTDEGHSCLRERPNNGFSREHLLTSSLGPLENSSLLHEFVSAPFSRNGLLSRPVLGGQPFRTLLNPLCSATHSMEKHMQKVITDSIRMLATPNDCARNHSDLNRMFLPITHRGGPKSLPESLDNPAFFRGGTHSGFKRDRRSYYLGEIYSLSKAWYLGEAWP